jgi:hypothetical protein
VTAQDVVLLCPAGFESVVARAAANELPGFTAERVDSGFIRARTTASANVLRAFTPATNVLAVAAEVPRGDLWRDIAELTAALPRTARPPRLPQRGAFRLRVHDDGAFASTSTPEAARLEQAVARWSGLAVSRRGGALEFWVLRRAGHPTTLLAAKLTGGGARVAAGTLRPEVAAALARVVPLRGDGPVLDPFAGSGSVVRALVDAGTLDVRGNDAGVPGGVDFRRLEVAPGSLAAVVTDPPWGHFADVPEGVDSLYQDLGQAAAGWLRPGGALVVLTGAPDSAVAGLLAAEGLAPEADLPVLVNGHKARVLLARKELSPGERAVRR